MLDTPPPVFTAAFRDTLAELFRWRRDVRRFRTDALPVGLLDELIATACLAPSVGNSQPWRFVTVDEPARRAAVTANFESANADALADYEGERARLYASLKLSGLRDAPAHVAVYCDTVTGAGHGLGKKTMPETLAYSVVGAVQTLWLAARAQGVGVGWVSILDPLRVSKDLAVPADWTLVAYLCVGYPVEEHDDPELVRAGWQDRLSAEDVIVRR